MIKAIFFDIDGTLISFKTHKIADSTIQALKDLRKKGIKLFIATGRGKDGLGALEDLPFDGFITMNGQYCFSGDEVIYENAVDKDDIKTLLNYIEDHPIACGFITKDRKFYNKRNERVEELNKITKNDATPASDVSILTDYNVYQCMLFVDEPQEKEIMKLLPNSISSRWHHLFCDVSPMGGTKQNGIDKFLEHFDIKLSETMALGDGGNDIPMLKHVAVGVAMGNASKEVKDVADYVTDDVDNDGVVNALKHFNLL
ncbi:Cof-type HAD-IIB family hydrolase [Breznakia pachnodae]|uniref:Cof subfamily protein (Haloacid dehalogenase superfamily) n=1 Tax=Breznakia pachnodae TaxID=265178 RepID=A0ABU0E4I2_9FIRM|nr:Cof-type HAD-IIB family hydrolase [Breznakia pachnodae]MDQ0361813.1 Cof subfamily protein (haloacid dehalogenase superfamily) [Breznakia pachnodae]